MSNQGSGGRQSQTGTCEAKLAEDGLRTGGIKTLPAYVAILKQVGISLPAVDLEEVCSLQE